MAMGEWVDEGEERALGRGCCGLSHCAIHITLRVLWPERKGSEMEKQAEDWARSTARIPLFEGLTEEELRKLLSVGRIREYAPGEKIIEEGQPSRELFILLSGEVGIEVAGVPLVTIKAVSPLGEMGVVDEGARSAGVVVSKRAKMVVIEKGEFDRILEEETRLGMKVYRNLAKVMSRRIRVIDGMVRRCIEGVQEWEEVRRSFM